jgi:hypothetical protein
MISRMVRTSVDEHRRLKQREDIKWDLLLLTISVYALDIYIYIYIYIYMVETRNAYRILVENLKKSDHFEEVGVDRRMILKGILKKKDDKASA